MTLEASSALLPLLRDRRSVRSYDDTHELSGDDLRALLEAARWAPSAGNSQPWAFLVARRGDAAHEAFVPLLSRGNLSWAPRASALLFTLHQVATGPEDDAFVYSDYAAYDLGQAVAQLSVQALALGLVVHQFAGFDHERLAEVARVPRHWRVTTGVALGRALPVDEPGDPLARERDGRPRTRKPLAEVAFGATFGAGLDLR
ncbi:nitroreductase family protein [Nocardioides sp. MAHUQ-72]|uniref:nitroreductase family protein n=1 Tax=unclassified Nocardioides TaxID=2615069 RepID=UPI0036242CF6